MTDDLILVRVPGWLLVRDRHGAGAEWRRCPNFVPLRPGPVPQRAAPRPPATDAFWPWRPVTTAQQEPRP